MSYLSDRLRAIVEDIEFCDGLAYELWDGSTEDDEVISVLFVGYRELAEIDAAVAELKSVLIEIVSPIVMTKLDGLFGTEERI